MSISAHSEHRRDLLAKLSSAADEVAQDAFAGLRWSDFSGQTGIQLVSELATQLAGSDLLPRRAQASRLRTLLLGLKPHGPESQLLAIAARDFPAHLRVTAAEFLPATLRPELYGARDTVVESVPASVLGEFHSTFSSSGPPVPAIAIIAGSEARASHVLDALPARDERAEYSTVLLLSHPDQQEGNVRRLMTTPAGLDPIGIQSIQEARQQLQTNREICACIIDQSFLETVTETEQREFFADVARYSTFLRLRIQDGAHLKLEHSEVERVLKRERGLGTGLPYAALTFQSDSNIRPAEVADLQRGRDLLRSHQGAEFVLGELTPSEARLLVAAVRTRVQAERLDGRVEIERLKTTFLSGGRSGARVATVQVNGRGRTYVAKVTSKQFALEEIPRFRSFVQEWDLTLQPEAHFHGDEAVMLFGLVPSDDNNSVPAPMLEDRLEKLWNDQWMQCENGTELRRRAEALGRGLERAAHGLERLNALEPVAGPFRCYGNPSTAHLEALDSEGFEWGMEQSRIEARLKALARFTRLERAAVVHGDIHLRNMLVRGDGDIHLIDYASSGPGHPALDLVRFEMALYVGPVRQFETESRCVAFQRAVSIDRASLDVLQEGYPTFFQCYVNEVCARGIVAARDAAINAVQRHGGDANDYLAAKYLVAWQHVGIIGSHTGLARAVIESLAPEINAWELPAL
jgi:Phosphotransferase enzyme family